MKNGIEQESPLYEFSNDPVYVIKTIELLVIFGSTPRQVQVNVNFFVVQVDSSYNVILGRTTLAALHAITSTPHFKIKFPTPD